MILKIFLALLLFALAGVTLWLIAYVICECNDCEEEFIHLTLYKFYTNEYKEKKPCVTFSQFISFYNVAPEKWIIDYESRVYYKQNNYLFPEEIYFTTHGDHYKYLRWRKKQIAYKKALNQNSTMSHLVKEWRKDAIAYQQKTYDEANKAYETILKNISEKE